VVVENTDRGHRELSKVDAPRGRGELLDPVACELGLEGLVVSQDVSPELRRRHLEVGPHLIEVSPSPSRALTV
jgi:hypothetical protein